MISPRVIATFALLVVLIAGCSSGTGDELGGSDESGGPSDGPAADDEDLPAEPEWTGAPLNPFDLEVGQCFNEYSWVDVDLDQRINLTTVVGCAEAHDREVYHSAEFPAGAGAPFPGETTMEAFSTELCYDAFEGFIGLEYELSEYQLSFLHPTKETFEHPVGRHRRVLCFIHPSNGAQTESSAAGLGV